METLRRILERIQQQLSVMTRSQQLAIGLCAVIIMGSLMWLAQWSTKPQLEPLLDQPMSLEELNTAVASLDALGAAFEERGDRIYVAPEERHRLVRQLHAQSALPQDTSLGFENLLKDQSPFQPESVIKRNYIIALQNELAAVIAADPNIAAATVFINDSAQRKLGALRSIDPTAAVNVTTGRGKGLDQAAVQAMADLVSGAVAGLEPHSVKVNVNGRPRQVPRPEDTIGFGLLEEKKKNEKHLEGKIYAQLSYIPGVKVAVTTELETTRKRVEKRGYVDPVPRMERELTEESSSGTPASEAGVSPNTGTALTNAASGQTTASGETQTEYFPRDIEEITSEEHIPFTIRNVTASVNIPRSYFVSVFKADNGAEAAPTDADLKPLIDIEEDRVRRAVKSVLGTNDDSAVQVDWFPDLSPESPGQFADSQFYAGVGATEDQGTMATLSGYVPQIGMVGLALLSLIMMVMLVRKSSRSVGPLPPLEPEPDEPEEEYTRPLESAELTEGFLVGQEVDEEALRVRQLGEQVSKMVDEDPESAAELIRRWVEQE